MYFLKTMLDLMWPLTYFIGFQIFLDGCILRAIILEALASVGFVDVWRVKLKAKGREKSHRFNFFLVEGLIVALSKFCTSAVILWRKKQLTFILKLDFLIDPFGVTNQAKCQDHLEIFHWSKHCISWSYTRTARFLYVRNALYTVVYLPTLMRYALVSRLRTKDINLRADRGQFLTPDSQIQTNCHLNTSLITTI